MKTLIQSFILIVALLLWGGVSFGQNITMQSGFFEQCSGSFLDSGAGGGSYQNNENFTLTICPDNPGDVVGVDFILFNLDQTNTANPPNNNQDRLIVYDGDSNTAPSLGNFSGTSAQGVFISASTQNTTGCLTFTFISNDAGVGDWAGQITCETPCDRPTAAGTSTLPASGRICLGEEITFDATTSFPAPGFNIVDYTWDFRDGTTANTAVATHSWDVPGEYIVKLFVVDDNGCASTNNVSFQVFVETLPSWDPFPGDSTICLGQTIDWSIDPTDFEVLWVGAEPEQFTVIDLFLPDDVGTCNEFPLQVEGFSPSQTLDNLSTLLAINIGIYHTYLFDLQIKLTCPSGQTVIMHNQMQQPTGPNVGSNGTDFGMPTNDECWQYQWTDVAPQTISQVATNMGWGGDPLPEDEYMSLEPLDGLLGCDLNGTWTLAVCDLWGGDSGYLCDWGLSLDPSLFPDVTQFTPLIGTEADSSTWSGPNIGDISADGNDITITPTEVGDFDFTYTLTNNHGCQHDSTVTVTVVPGPQADAGPPLVLCEDSLQLMGSVAGTPPPPPTCDYTIDMHDTFGDGWSGFSVIVLIDGVQVGTYSITGAEGTATIPVTHGSTIQINTTNGSWLSEISYELLDAAGNIIFSDGGGFGSVQVGTNIFNGIVDCQPGAPDYVYEWSPTTGLSDPNIADPMVMVNQNTTYTLTVWQVGTPECATSDEVEVSIPEQADPGQDNAITLCYNEPQFNMVDSLLGTPTDSGVWTDAAGNPANASFSPSDHLNGGTFTYTYTVTFGPCVKSAELEITVLEAGHEDCCQTLADAGTDAVACGLTWQLDAQPTIGTGTWTGPANVSFADVNDPTTTVTAAAPGGVIELYWTDNNGFMCELTDTVEIVFSEPLQASLLPSPATCPDTCDGEVLAGYTGGLGEMTYAWSHGLPGGTDAQRISLCPGNITVYLEDEYGCTDSTVAVISELPPPMIEDLIITDARCFGECNGSVEVIAPDAVSYSFDQGATFSPSPLLEGLCKGEYDIEIRDADNCPNYGVVTINEPIEVEAEFSMNPGIANWDNTTIQFNSLSYPEPFVSYSWVFDTLNTLGVSSEKRPVFTFPDTEAGVYPVSLCVENEAGCSDCVSYDLVVRETLLVFIPNSFTPNGDGINDLFKAFLSTEDYSDFSLQIFNRNGELVFETLDPEEGWNGGYANSDYYALDEVYVYQLKVTDDVTGETLEYKGRVTTIR